MTEDEAIERAIRLVKSKLPREYKVLFSHNMRDHWIIAFERIEGESDIFKSDPIVIVDKVSRRATFLAHL